jgi:hypothetical protein
MAVPTLIAEINIGLSSEEPTKWCYRVPSENFFLDGIDIREASSVTECRQAVAANYTVNFLLGFFLNFGEQSHCKHECLHR